MSAIKSVHPTLKQDIVSTASGSKVSCYSSDLGNGPILILIHGYPQSSFEWRYMIPQLKDKVSLFVPELPGYGISTPCKVHSKKEVGTALLEALTAVFKPGPREVILGGHDRGARITHRLAVDKDDYDLNIIGCVMLDIIPTKAQWDAFSNPIICSGYFHWPLLANVQLAVKMLEAFGGGNWCRAIHSRITGGNEEGRRRVFSDNAVEIYAEQFDKHETLVGSCEDYEQGSAPEAAAQAEDQKNGKKIKIPALVMWSKANLGARIEVDKVWEDWVQPGKLKAIGVGDGYGHFLPEEAPDELSSAILAFLKELK